jgi:UDPglucose 6-dehydrogenase
VTCVDKDADMIAALRRGEMPIYEPDLDRLVAVNTREGRLTFSTEMAAAVSSADAIFIAVGTPSRRGDGYADLSYVYAAAREMAPALSGYTVVVTKSTVPVGTGDEVERILREARPDVDISVVSNPEFLREGATIRDFKHPRTSTSSSVFPVLRPVRLAPLNCNFFQQRSVQERGSRSADRRA